MPAPKMWSTAQGHNGQLHVLGGLNAENRAVSDHDVFMAQ